MALIRNTSPDALRETPAESYSALLAKLGDENVTARRLAARDLAQFPHASHDLIARLDKESDALVREAIVTSLTALADIDAVSTLIDCLRSEDAALRNDAIDGLKTAGARYPQLIHEALQDPDPDVRILTIGVLSALSHREVEQWLIDVLDQESHLNVCACAVDVLYEIGSESAVPALHRCAARFSDETYLQFAVGLAIQRLQGGSAL